MKYEAHVTVAARPCPTNKFKLACQDMGAKPVLIYLDDDEHLDVQPMTSYTFEASNDEDAKYIIRKQAIYLYKRGFRPARLKLEMESTNRPCLYHETHFKVAFVTGDRRPEDEDYKSYMFEIFGAKLSRNAWSKSIEGQVRFFTLREHGSYWEFIRRTIKFSDFLTENGYTFLSRQSETVIYDTNIKLDAGWLDEPRERCREEGQ